MCLCVSRGIRSWTEVTGGFVSGLQPEGATSTYLEWASDGPSGNDFSTAHQLGMINITLTHNHVQTHTCQCGITYWSSLYSFFFSKAFLILSVITHTVCVRWHSQQAVGDQRPSCLYRTHWAVQPTLQQHFLNITETLALSPLSTSAFQSWGIKPCMEH